MPKNTPETTSLPMKNGKAEVIDIPVLLRGYGGHKWADIANQLQSLPPGKALEVICRSAGNAHRMLGSYGLRGRVRTATTGENTLAIWLEPAR